MAIQPKVRVFYELDTARAVETKALKLQEYVTSSMLPSGTADPFPLGTPARSEVLSGAKRDPQTYNFITVLSSAIADDTFRTLRVIAPGYLVKDTKNLVGLPDIANPTPKPPPFTGDISKLVGSSSNVVEKGSVKPVKVLTVSTDADIKPPLLLVHVDDPQAQAEQEQQKTKYILIVERTEIVVVPEVNWPKYKVYERSPGDFDILGQFKDRFKILIADALQIGPVVRVIQVNNTAGAKIVDATQNPGIVEVLEVSENHNSSNQEGKYGKIGVSRLIDPVTKEKRFFMQWKPPESDDYGLPVEIGGTGTSICPFTMKCLVDVDNPSTGGTFTKELRIRVNVQSSKLVDSEFVESWVNITTVFDKTYDGRPIFGNFMIDVPPDKPFEEVMPSIQVIQPITSILEPEEQGPNGPVRQLNVDDQGLFLYYSPDRPIPAGRTTPSAVFQRRFTDQGVISGEDQDGNIQVEDTKVLKKIVLPEKSHPIWLVASPTEKFITYAQEKGALRPYSKQPDSPDSLVYPYRWATPVNFATDPETIPSDETLLLFPESAGYAIARDPLELIFPYQNRLQHFRVPYVRLTDQIYFFFVIEDDILKELKINPSEIAYECLEQGEDPADIDTTFRDRPISSHLTTSGSVQFSPGQAYIPNTAESVLILAYPQEQRAGQNALADRMQELAESCESQPRSDLEELDVLQEIVNINQGQS